MFRDHYPDLDVFGKIKIGDHSFIGYYALIMPGVQIGERCVVGAGSVVTKSVPDNSVVAGNPARLLGSTDTYLEKLLAHNAKTHGDSQKSAILNTMDEDLFLRPPSF